MNSERLLLICFKVFTAVKNQFSTALTDVQQHFYQKVFQTIPEDTVLLATDKLAFKNFKQSFYLDKGKPRIRDRFKFNFESCFTCT